MPGCHYDYKDPALSYDAASASCSFDLAVGTTVDHSRAGSGLVGSSLATEFPPSYRNNLK